MSKKNYLWLCIGYGVLFLSLFLVVTLQGGALDLRISQILVQLPEKTRYSSSIFGRIFESIGEFPIYVIIQLLCLFWVKLLYGKKNHIWAKIAIGICLFFALFMGVYGFHKMEQYVARYFEGAHEMWLSLLHPTSLLLNVGLSLCMMGVCSFFVIKIKLEHIQQWLFLSIVIALAMALSQFFVHLAIKPLWARERYRAMMTLDGSVDAFTPWYQLSSISWKEIPSAIKDDFRSFPSGHTASAAMLEGLLFLPYYFPKIKKSKKVLCCVLPFLYTGIVAFSRIYVGAHFTSDVLFGGSISFACMMLSFFLFEKCFKGRLLSMNEKQKRMNFDNE